MSKLPLRRLRTSITCLLHGVASYQLLTILLNAPQAKEAFQSQLSSLDQANTSLQSHSQAQQSELQSTLAQAAKSQAQVAELKQKLASQCQESSDLQQTLEQAVAARDMALKVVSAVSKGLLQLLTACTEARL